MAGSQPIPGVTPTAAADDAAGSQLADGVMDLQYALREETFDNHGVALTIRMPRAAEELIDENAFANDERLPYWADLWPSSRALARWLVRHQPEAGTRVIELGCGLGLPSLVLHQIGIDVVATDYEPQALAFTAANAVHNNLPPLKTALLDWRSAAEYQRESGGARFDLALIADAFYEPHNVRALVDALAELVRPGGECIIADPGRRYLPDALQELRINGWRVEPRAVLAQSQRNGNGPVTIDVQIIRAVRPIN